MRVESRHVAKCDHPTISGKAACQAVIDSSYTSVRIRRPKHLCVKRLLKFIVRMETQVARVPGLTHRLIARIQRRDQGVQNLRPPGVGWSNNGGCRRLLLA